MSAEAALLALLARIDEREADVRAWVRIDRNSALARARALDMGAEQGPLHGLAVGVKDVIDTADMPTEYNSPIYGGYRPAQDADVVAQLKAAGAIVLGKTVTTEFAFMVPGPTRNPHNLDCTPGGSSSGSAAAVASGMVPVALATQTSGSTIRPAAFCGIIGYKPAFGRYPTRGLKHLAASLDTIGLHATDLDVLARVSVVLSGTATPSPAPATKRFVLLRTPNDGQAEQQAIARLDQATRVLADAGASVRELVLPHLFAEIDPVHRTIMAKEASWAFAKEWASNRTALSSDLVKLVEQGLTIDADMVGRASALVEKGKRAFATLVEDGEVGLTLPAPGEAPVGLASTGSAAFNRLWTLLGLPCLTLPVGRGVRGLPLGVQLVGKAARKSEEARIEDELLSAAAWAHAAFAAAGI